MHSLKWPFCAAAWASSSAFVFENPHFSLLNGLIIEMYLCIMYLLFLFLFLPSKIQPWRTCGESKVRKRLKESKYVENVGAHCDNICVIV